MMADLETRVRGLELLFHELINAAEERDTPTMRRLGRAMKRLRDDGSLPRDREAAKQVMYEFQLPEP